mmetsp:Transcript_34809/g.100028  ORF Transcript_34809/g.100028 Transcript_34809/m.100028 type:complete len:789 (-) Transcript_34809:74-2440(-)
MGNRAPACSSCNTQRCADELGLARTESRDPDCDPAGTVFNETLEGLPLLDQEVLRFAGTANLSAVRWLLAMGADIRVRDSHGTTLLHAACRSGSCAVVRELLHQGAAPDAMDTAGWTPLHVAALMGRRPLVVLLLQHSADATAKNKRGATAAAVCTDPGMREVFQGPGASALQGLPASDGHGGVRGDASDRTTCCVPFFVPRKPLFIDAVHNSQLVSLCSEMLDRSVGHGLAFSVAVGVVKDRPTDLSHFLLQQRIDPARLGEFLGEELSMSETLRLAFMDSMDLFNTGVVGALYRAFRHIHAPRNFGKMDRLTTAVAHMWWRAHDALDDVSDDEEGLRSPPAPEPGCELRGLHLRQHLHSVEGLQRLMFSTVMLYWALHGSKMAVPMTANVSKDHLSLHGWLNMNLGIEVHGSEVPECVLEGIYLALIEQDSRNLLPSFDTVASPRSLAPPEHCSQGWAYIPPGGLERFEQVLATANGGSPQTPHLAQCILSEASPTHLFSPRKGLDGQGLGASAAMDAGAEAVWLTLRCSLILFLATSPCDAAPYAFMRLTDAVLRDVDRSSRQLVLAGRLRRLGPSSKPNAEGAALEAWTPFGDIARHPLELCFLLRDGRFQSFAALWLELRFGTDEDLELWLAAFGAVCREPPRGGGAEPLAGGEKGRTPALHRGIDVEEPARPRVPKPVSPAADPRSPPPSPPGSEPRQPRTHISAMPLQQLHQPHLPRFDPVAPLTPNSIGGTSEDEAEPAKAKAPEEDVGERQEGPQDIDKALATDHCKDATVVRIVTNFV